MVFIVSASNQMARYSRNATGCRPIPSVRIESGSFPNCRAVRGPFRSSLETTKDKTKLETPPLNVLGNH